MEDYISDSDDEGGYKLLDSSSLSEIKLRTAIEELDDLNKTRLKTLFEGARFRDPLRTAQEIGNACSDDTSNRNETSVTGNTDASTQYSESINNSDISNANSIAESVQSNTLNSDVGNRVSRRELRKRTFASTHPYIADQAHWLGLSSIEELNLMYQDTDDNSILRFLNKSYLKNKKRYPNDDKYKQKNFYSHLGSNFKILALETDELEEDSYEKDIDDEDYYHRDTRPTPKIYDSESESEPDFKYYSDSDIDDGLIDMSILRVTSNNKLESLSLEVTPSSGSEIDTYDSMDYDSSFSISEDPSLVVGSVSNSLYSKLPSRKLIKGNAELPRNFINSTDKTHQKGTMKKGLMGQSAVSKRSREILNDVSNLRKQSCPENEAGEFSKEYYFSKNKSSSHMNQVTNQNSYSATNIVSISDDEDENVSNTPSTRIQGAKFKPLLEGRKIVPQNSAAENFNSNDEATESDIISPLFAFERGGESKKSSYTMTRKSKPPKKGNENGVVNIKNLSLTNRRKVNGFPESRRYSTLKKRPMLGLKARSLIKKSIQLTDDISQIPRKSSKRSMVRAKSRVISIINPREVLKDKYSFSRVPNAITTDIEAVDKEINHKNNKGAFSENIVGSFPIKSYSTNENYFNDDLPFDIDLNKLPLLRYGQYYETIVDPLVVENGKVTFIFTSIDKQMSQKNILRMMDYMLSILIGKSNDFAFEDFLSECFRALIKWSLSVQSSPSQETWLHFAKLFLALSKVKSGLDTELRLMLLFFAILLNYIWIELSIKNGMHDDFIQEKSSQLVTRAIIFWARYIEDDFSNVGSDVLISNSIRMQAVHFMSKLSIHAPDICLPAISAVILKSSIEEHDFQTILRKIVMLLFVCNSGEYGWTVINNLYDKFKFSSSSEIHVTYLDCVKLFNRELKWSIDEKVIHSLYAGIASRKFSNFEFENVNPGLLMSVHGDELINPSSQFNNFLALLSNYFKSSKSNVNKKRLLNKLFTSSHFQYSSDSKSYAIFINRINFILVLSKFSDVDLRGQFEYLISQVSSSGDIKFLEVAVQGISCFSEHCTENGIAVSYRGIFMLLLGLSNIYENVLGAVKLTDSLINLIYKCIERNNYTSSNSGDWLELIKHMISFPFISLNDEESVKMAKLLLHLVLKIKDLSFVFTEEMFKGLNELCNIVHSTLNYHMGRLPIQNVLISERVNTIIENSIKIWICLSSSARFPNWNLLLHQKYPYMGSNYSRNSFLLLVYCELAKYADIEAFKVDVTFAVLRDLASYNTSLYLPTILEILSKSSIAWFHFKNYNQGDAITALYVHRFKLEITYSLFLCINHEKILSKEEKALLFEEFFKRLNLEYSRHHSDSCFVSYCKSVINTIEKPLFELLSSISDYKSLSTRLGILRYDIDIKKWCASNTLQRLAMINEELISALMYNKSTSEVLEKYTSFDCISCLFFLVDIYSKSVKNNQRKHWMFISLLLDFILSKLQNYCINISDIKYLKFLKSLSIIVAICSPHNNVEAPFQYFELKSLNAVLSIIKTSYFLFEGYRDHEEIKEISKKFLDILEHAGTIDVPLEDSFSNYLLFDLERHSVQSNISTNQTIGAEYDVEKEKENLFLLHSELQGLLRASKSFSVMDFDLKF